MPTMPNVVGVNFYEALEQLQTAGVYTPKLGSIFGPSTVSVAWGGKSAQYQGGIVMAQLPASGATAAAGAPITLTLADYPFSSVVDMPPDWQQSGYGD